MKSKRLNLIQPVRQMLMENSMSSVKVVAAVNAALGELASKEAESKLGDGKSATKGTLYKVSEVETTKYEGVMTAPLLFDAWHSAVKKAYSVATFETIGLPSDGRLKEWLPKFVAETDSEKKELEKEKEIIA